MCKFSTEGTFHVVDKHGRYLPYLAGGIAGVGLAIYEIRKLLKNNDIYLEELNGIKKTMLSKCYYLPGLFKGASGVLAIADKFDDLKVLDYCFKKLNLYLIDYKDKLYIPGEYCYRLSGDLFSGSAGTLAVLNDLNKVNDNLTWLPVIYK